MTEESERAADRLEVVGRAGWAAKGTVYVVFGLVAAQLVVGGPGRSSDADQRGALEALADRPAGGVLLVALAAGLATYAAWRLVTAVRPPNDENRLERSGYLLSAVWYLVLTWAALQLVVDDDGSDRHVVERWSARLLGTDLGAIAVGAVGLVIVGVGVMFGWRAVRFEFVEELDTTFVEHEDRRDLLDAVYRWFGAAGWLGRAIVTAAVGAFAVAAAVDADVESATGFDGLLRRVAAAPAGSLAVIGIASLLVVYGTFCVLSTPARQAR